MMKKIGVIVVVTMVWAGCVKKGSVPDDLVTAVNPRIGTGGIGWGVGSTYPGPAWPFGMIHPGPDTRAEFGAPGFNHCAGYWYEDEYIEGFSLARMEGTGAADYGNIAFMPVDGMDDSKKDEEGYKARFNHGDEMVELGRYGVKLQNGMEVEVASGLRVALMRFRWPESTEKPVILVDLEHTLGSGTSDGGEVRIQEDVARGWMHNQGELSARIGGFPVFFYAEVDTRPREVGTWDDGGLHPGQEQAQGVDLGAWWSFPRGTREVVVRVGLSFVDEDGARKNLEAELMDWDLEALQERTRAAWAKAFSVVEMHDLSEEDRTKVATALYRTLSMPTLWSDQDGRIRMVDGNIGRTEGPRYTDFSLWDTYRTLHPWLGLLEDEHLSDMIGSLVAIGMEGGAIPRWELAHGDVHSMIGDPGVIAVADARLKGVMVDAAALEMAWQTAKGPAMGLTGGRGQEELQDYLDLGYVSADSGGGAVAKTLEYVAADLALAEWCEKDGMVERARELRDRAEVAWNAIYDRQEGFFRARKRDGSWSDWSGPLVMDEAYTEGTAWQYLWLLLQDSDALAELLGGKERALDRLREFFEASRGEEPNLGLRTWYWHGNEPDIHAPFLFAAWGEREEGRTWVDWVVDKMYGVGPDGLPGNDDGATLSAWLLLAHAGLYPVAGTDRYILAVPRQSKMVLHRASGDLVIERVGDPKGKVKKITLDQEPVSGPFLRHDELVGYHRLRFELE